MPFGKARLVERLQRLTGQPVVAADGVGDQCLDAGVADVLQLLVVGRIHVGFVRVEAGGAPADLPDLLQVGIAGFQLRALLERIGGEIGRQGLQVERLGAGVISRSR